MRNCLLISTLALVPFTIGACADAPETGAYPDQSSSPSERTVTEGQPAAETTPGAPVLDGLTMNRIDGTPETLSEVYAGKTLLIVNTASRCGLTAQYEQLEALYQDRSGDGLVVLGFPANNFMGQEPGSNSEIAEFCSANYNVTFPMFEKVSVKGGDTSTLFTRLTDATSEPSWNFTKYLVTPDGRITRFDPRTSPTDPALVEAIDAALNAG